MMKMYSRKWLVMLAMEEMRLCLGAMVERGNLALKIINYLRREVIAESDVYVDGKEVGMIVLAQEGCNDSLIYSH